jgi:hypothetical protein
MVAAVHFFATENDEQLLLDYVFASSECRLFPWIKMNADSPVFLDRRALPPQSEAVQRFGILNPTLGEIHFVMHRPTEGRPDRFKSTVINQLNWEKWAPAPGEGIVDWDQTPALFWERCKYTAAGTLILGNIGTQATAMEDMSPEYRLWVNRVMAWVRRNGSKVAQAGKLTSAADGLDLKVTIWSSLFALPDAMRHFESGSAGRQA